METPTEMPEELAVGGWQPNSPRSSSSEVKGVVSLSGWSDGPVVVHAAWQRVFDRFDKDRSGLLDMAEVSEGLHILLGSKIMDSTLRLAMRKFDKDMSGQLDIKEFGKLINDLKASRKSYIDPPLLEHEGSILGKDKKLPLQDVTFHIYQNRFFSTFVAFCIIGNFCINILEKEIDPDSNDLKYGSFWSTADVTLNIIFLSELLANMWGYGGPVKAFWVSGWNVFDAIIVAVGLLTMVAKLPTPLEKLKLMRAFRIFRLFKRVESLNKIIVALFNSIPGVVNAFIVMLVFFCIYAILAVELFRDFGESGTYPVYDSTTGNTTMIDAKTARGYVLGIEYYGTFMRALYTLFQVMTGESWSEAVARPLLFGWDDAVVPGLFFVSFIIVTQIVLINVVVAVLLEKFVAHEPTDEDEEIAVDERLANLDREDDLKAMNAKLDQVVDIYSTLRKTVTELNASVADLKNRIDHQNEIQLATEESVEVCDAIISQNGSVLEERGPRDSSASI